MMKSLISRHSTSGINKTKRTNTNRKGIHTLPRSSQTKQGRSPAASAWPGSDLSSSSLSKQNRGSRHLTVVPDRCKRTVNLPSLCVFLDSVLPRYHTKVQPAAAWTSTCVARTVRILAPSVAPAPRHRGAVALAWQGVGVVSGCDGAWPKGQSAQHIPVVFPCPTARELLHED